MNTFLITFSFLFLCMGSLSHANTVMGYVDAPSTTFSKNYVINGWACQKKMSHSINVHVYVGGAAGQGQFFKAVKANRTSEAAVANACQSTGNAYRFKIPVQYSEADLHKGKKIYVHGISTTGGRNLLITNSGKYLIPTPPVSKIIGQIDSLTLKNGAYQLKGWSCQIGNENSNDVHLYVGGPAGTGVALRAARANIYAEQAVADACFTQNRKHRFSILISKENIIDHPNKKIYVHGISLNGTANLTINRSGILSTPNTVTLSELIDYKQSGDITIPKNLNVNINQSASVGKLTINGQLNCPTNGHYELKTDGILIDGSGSTLACGSASNPVNGNITFTLKNNRPTGMMGAKGIVATNGGVLSLFGKSGKSGFVKLSKTAEPGDTTLNLTQSFNWQVGDSIVIASTDYDYKHAEKMTIKSISSDRKSIVVNAPLSYRHWGSVETFSNGKGKQWVLDERAEVINLSRHIKIQSENDSYVQQETPMGAHVMIMGNGAKGYVDSVEFYRVGQMSKMGRYPFHWHHSGNASGQFIKNSSIHDSYHRCVTIHATNNALVKNNACYNHFGHGFFLEEGHEVGNRIYDNIGLVSKRFASGKQTLVSELKADPFRYEAPATFWISNPSNYVDNNVAAGSQGTGFWLSFKKSVHGLKPISSKTFSFNNNTAHSSVVGITHDGAPSGTKINNPLNTENDFKLMSAHYDPAVAPTFNNLVAYKNLNTGIYYRGSRAIYNNAILADNGASGFFAYDQELIDSLVVGMSNNHPQSEIDYFANRSQWHGRQSGVRVYDGPFYLDNVHFANFPTEAVLSSNGKDMTPTAVMLMGGAARFVNLSKNLTFSPSNLKYKLDLGYGPSSQFGRHWLDSYSTAILDLDGSLTGRSNWLARPTHPMNTENNCVAANEFQGFHSVTLCQQSISHLRILDVSGAEGNTVTFNVMREYLGSQGESDAYSYGSHANKNRPDYFNKFSMIMGGDYRYKVSSLVASSLYKLYFSSDHQGDISPVVVFESIGSQCRLQSASEVSTYNQLLQSNNPSYYRSNGDLYIKVKATSDMTKMRSNAPRGRGEFSISC